MNQEPAPPLDIPAKSFELAWRWTSETHAVLPDDVLRAIHPLTAAEAEALSPESNRRCTPLPVAAYSLSIFAEWDDVDPVRKRLQDLPVAEHAEVIVHWLPTLAVRTTWGIFVQYWSEFCYPSSDDVTVWSPDEAWTLCYRHFEFFQFQAGQPGS